MSILFICNNKDPHPWARALKEILPEEKIEIYPEVENYNSVEFIVCWRPEKDIFKKFPNLKGIQSLGAAVSHIFESGEINNSIQIARIVDNRLSRDMWEFALAAVLFHIKNINLYATGQRNGIWQQNNYKSAEDISIGILGLGKIGGYAAGQFAEMGFRVGGWSISERQIPKVKSYTRLSGLKELLRNSNILINILPLTELTRGLLNKEVLSNLKSGGYLINIGRGEHLVETDLIDLLDSGHLSGAFLDVFETEPLPKEHPFWMHPLITVTPHVAALTNIDSAIGQIAENITRLKNNSELLNTVSHERKY